MSQYTYNHQGWGRRGKRRSPSRPQLIKNLLLAAIALGFVLSLVGLITIALASRNLPNPNSLTQRAISQTTKIYDRTGEHLLYEIFGEENRTLTKIQKGFCQDDDGLETDPNGIPLFAMQATIAAEDRGFCKHGGFDLKGFLRAVFQNLRGNRVGGSTLTQQLVKNAILSNEKTLTRKVKELVLSLELERRYSKDEILQIYFNEIPYGSTYYGIEAAAQNFFGTSAGKLTLAQAATLAALPKAPTTYINNPDRLLARRNYILGVMEELEFITQKQKDEATKEDTSLKARLTGINAPHFVLYVKEQLEELYGQRAVEEGGLNVITTLNWDYQQIAQEELTKHVEAKGKALKFTNAALVAMDPKSGHILAMVGSKDYFDDEIDGQVNIALRSRQPGSSFKPIVFTKAFEIGYTPNTVLWDVATDFPSVTGIYTPQNYDSKQRGPVRVREALQLSLNIPAVKMGYLVGIDKVLDLADAFGYTTLSDRSRFGLSLSLGGGEVKLLEHTSAYGVLANEGMRHDPVSLLRVEDHEGVILHEWKPKKGIRVVDENVARTITHVLSDNAARTPVFGANSPLFLGERPVAAKTGTTNNNRDAWLMGYTPSLAVGVWAGNNDNTEMTKHAGGFSAAGPIWNAFLRRVTSSNPIETFTAPVIRQTGKPMLDGSVASTTLTVDKASGKLATQYTPESYRTERTFASYHSLLHTVDPKDPLGPPPTDPGKDPLYTLWEEGIRTWIAQREAETGKTISQEVPPTEFDDIHIPENFPVVKISSPLEGGTTGRTLEALAAANAPRGVSRMEFYVDGLFIGSDETSPFGLTVTLPNAIERGFHTLKAVAYDDVENQGSTTVGFTVQENPSDAVISLVDPKNGQTIEKNGVAYSVVVSLKNPSSYSWVRVFADPIGAGARQLIGQQANPSSVFPTFEWELPEAGSYALTAEGMTKTGDAVKTAGVVVRVTTKEDEMQEGGNELFVPENPIELF
ncbi:hypothetical protein FJZ23_01685 [Candidatus Parcubacteria bacterium]|nr:hypothetical protein [Candidatus Parcubacteria bacterium]